MKRLFEHIAALISFRARRLLMAAIILAVTILLPSNPIVDRSEDSGTKPACQGDRASTVHRAAPGGTFVPL